MSESPLPVSLLAFTQGTPLDQAAGTAPAAPGSTAAPGAPGAGGTPGSGGGKAPPPDNTFLFMVLGLVAVMFVMTIFTGRRQKKQRETMLSGLRKHDRVVTTGGIIGSVVEIKPRTIVLKVDEGSNTRITFSREAIQQVIEEAAEGAASETKT